MELILNQPKITIENSIETKAKYEGIKNAVKNKYKNYIITDNIKINLTDTNACIYIDGEFDIPDNINYITIRKRNKNNKLYVIDIDLYNIVIDSKTFTSRYEYNCHILANSIKFNGKCKQENLNIFPTLTHEDYPDLL